MEKQNLKKSVAEKLRLSDMPAKPAKMPTDMPAENPAMKKKVTSIEVINGKVVAMFSEGGRTMRKEFNNFQEFADYADNFFGLNKGGGMPEDELEAGGNPFAQLKNKDEELTEEEEELV